MQPVLPTRFCTRPGLNRIFLSEHEIGLYNCGACVKLEPELMRNQFCLIGAVLVIGFLAAGCAGPEKKLGRGINNTLEIVRLGEMSRSIEQTALFDSPRAGYTVGLVRGFNRTLARTGLGLYEIITFPLPSYRPIWTNYLSATPAYPDSYKPGRPASQMFATDVDLGFSGGDVMPWAPGSRFKIFENQ